jgi:hypothetical protein
MSIDMCFGACSCSFNQWYFCESVHWSSKSVSDQIALRVTRARLELCLISVAAAVAVAVHTLHACMYTRYGLYLLHLEHLAC